MEKELDELKILMMKREKLPNPDLIYFLNFITFINNYIICIFC